VHIPGVEISFYLHVLFHLKVQELEILSFSQQKCQITSNDIVMAKICISTPSEFTNTKKLRSLQLIKLIALGTLTALSPLAAFFEVIGQTN
jgi:hypothetical protein